MLNPFLMSLVFCIVKHLQLVTLQCGLPLPIWIFLRALHQTGKKKAWTFVLYQGSATVWRHSRSDAASFHRHQFPWARGWPRFRLSHEQCRIQRHCWCPWGYWVRIWWQQVECWDMDGQSWWITQGGKLWSASHAEVGRQYCNNVALRCHSLLGQYCFIQP